MNSMSREFRTFTSTDDQIFICTTKRRTYNIFLLLLPQEPPRDLRGLDLYQLHLTIRHVNKHIPAVFANTDTRHLCSEYNAVELFPGYKVIHEDLALGGDGDEALAIGRDGAILDAVVGWPAVQLVSLEVPQA